MSKGLWASESWRHLAPLVAILLLGGSVAIRCGKESSAPGPTPVPTPPATVHPGSTKIGEITIDSVSQGWGTPQLDLSVMGRPLVIAGQSYRSGIGTHAASKIEISFPSRFKTFSGACGVDGYLGNRGSIVCKIVGGDKTLFTSPLLKGGAKVVSFSIPVGGLSKLTLFVEDGGDGIDSDHADWVDLRLR